MQKGIYQELKKMILFLNYAPGEALAIRDIAKQFQVSPTPIREALIRLEGEGLVRRFPNRSVHVTEVSFQNLKDIFETRLFLMELVGRLAAQRITDAELGILKELLDAMKIETDRRRKLHIDAQLHQRINEATKNNALSGILEMLRNQLTRLWFFVRENNTYESQMAEDFEALIAALQGRDEEQSIKILRDHTVGFIHLVQDSILHERDVRVQEGSPDEQVAEIRLTV